VNNIFIQGIESLLGSYFAARCLRNMGSRVFFGSDIPGEKAAGLVLSAARQIGREEGWSLSEPEIRERLQQINPDCVGQEGAQGADTLWWFANGRGQSIDSQTFEPPAVLGCKINAKEVNYVAFDCAGGQLAADISEQEIANHCGTSHLKYRFFMTPLILGAACQDMEHSEVLSQFLSVLFSLKAEIEERSSQYFDFQALRCYAAAGSVMSMASATRVTELLMRVAEGNNGTNFLFTISPQRNVQFTELCEQISMAYSLSLLPSDNRNSLNAIDRIFQENSPDLEHCCLAGGASDAPVHRASESVSVLQDDLEAEERLHTLLERCLEEQEQALAEHKRRAAELHRTMTRKTITRHGSDLVYYVGGNAGVPVVVLNALGQGLESWWRLLHYLGQSHRVVIWEPRGTIAPPPPFGLDQQVEDVSAILEHERMDKCHLIGWCTGPKVAIQFFLRHPNLVSSMAFLNTSLKCAGTSEELNSPYEENMESVCRMLVRKPAMASAVMKTLNARTDPDEAEILEGSDSEQIGESVLSLMNRELKTAVLAPFRTEETIVNYAHQLVDFWNHDVRPQAGNVTIPVLLLSTEYDQVATPAASVEAAALLPNAHHVHVNGATHYCLFDRPDFVARLLQRFFLEGIPGGQATHEAISTVMQV
jgi:pimeloyl-ACP methyl ester carboxylesterase